MILGENAISELRSYGFIFSVVFCIDLTILVGSESRFHFENLLSFHEVIMESKIGVIWLLSMYQDTFLCRGN